MNPGRHPHRAAPGLIGLRWSKSTFAPEKVWPSAPDTPIGPADQPEELAWQIYLARNSSSCDKRQVHVNGGTVVSG